MSIIEALRAGRRGVRLAVPTAWSVELDEDAACTLIDTEVGIQWHLFYVDGAAFDLSDAGWPSLQRDVREHADYLFELMRRIEHAKLASDEPLPPRPQRHPLISCERVSVDGGQGLRVLHRMVMRPGLEIVMGHLLVPAADGLFEARWIAQSNATGMRESVLLMKAMGTTPTGPNGNKDDREPDEVEALMRSIDYDAPAHDADFPDHPLSVARAAGRAICEDLGLRVLRTPANVPAGEDTLSSLSVALVPPPRFARTSEGRKSVIYRRYSLAGNDGEQLLGIEIAPAGADLEELARTVTRSLGAKPTGTRRSGALVVCDGSRELDEVRIAIVAAPLDGGKQAVLQLVSTTSFLVDEIAGELSAAARSVRALPKPWWKLW